MKKDRHWYQALEGDGINLLALWKESDKLGISDTSLKTYKNGGKPAQNNKIEAILSLIQSKDSAFKREDLDQYLKRECTKRSENISLNCRHLLNSLKEFDDESLLITGLSGQFETSDRLKIVKQTESIVSQGSGKATNSIMNFYSNPIDAEIEASPSLSCLSKLEKLIGALALVATNTYPPDAIGKPVTLWVESDEEDWMIQLMLDQKRLPFISVMKRITLNDSGQLAAQSGVSLGGSVKSETKAGLLKELHCCIDKITQKLAIPKLKCPELTIDDNDNDNKAFWHFSTELRDILFARNASKNYIFATVKETMPEALTDMVLDYLTESDDDDSERALEIFKLSLSEGHKPYRLKAGRFSAWIIERWEKINKESNSSNDEENQTAEANEAKNEGEEEMNQASGTGNFIIGKVDNLTIEQDNRSTYINHKDVLSELKQQITGQSDTEQGLRDSIQTAANEEPKEENAEEQKSRWQRIKNGIETLENSAKIMLTFDKAYAAVIKVAPWLTGVF